MAEMKDMPEEKVELIEYEWDEDDYIAEIAVDEFNLDTPTRGDHHKPNENP